MGSNEYTGVLVGADKVEEWLLPWFYTHFRKYNPDCPIAFANFGMSLEAQNWCRDRGALFEVPESPSNTTVPTGFLFQGDLWKERNLHPSSPSAEKKIWFRKSLAIAISPFYRTLWLDLDCQIRGDISPLLSLPLSSGKLGVSPCGSFCSICNLSKDLLILVEKYNSGVLLTEKDSPLLDQWASLIDGHLFFRTEEAALSFLIDRNPMQVTQISHLYNWPISNWGENEKAVIHHFLGKEGKKLLYQNELKIWSLDGFKAPIFRF